MAFGTLVAFAARESPACVIPDDKDRVLRTLPLAEIAELFGTTRNAVASFLDTGRAVGHGPDSHFD
jgi:hypothetical protein